MTPAERAAQVAVELDLRDPSEIDVELIAAHYGAVTVYRPLRREEGRLIRRGGKGLIVVDERLEFAPRSRFVVAHELGHFLLHEGIDQFFLCNRADLSEYRSSGVEAEANHFAAELLMPEPLFAPHCAEETPSLRLVKDLSNRFRTSRVAAARRVAKYSPSPMAVVISSEGRIRHVTPSPSFRGLLPTDALLGRSTVAARVFEGTTRAASEWVEASAWLSDEPGEVFEDTMCLGQTGLVLTVLRLG